MEKVKKERAGIFSNLIFSIKTIYKIDKVYVYQRIILAILLSINVFFYAYVLKTAIAGIEKGWMFSEMVARVFFIAAISFLISAITRIIGVAWYRSRLISMVLAHQTGLRTLDIEYGILERPETQNLLEKAFHSSYNNSGVISLFQRFCSTLQYFITFVIASVIIISVNWLLVLLIVFLSFLKILIENKNQKRKKREFYDVAPPIRRRFNYSDSISRNLSVGKDLRVYQMDRFINYERDLAVSEYIEITRKDIRKSFISRLFVELVAIADGLFLYGFMIYEVLYNNMSIADFTFMVASVFQLIRALYQLIRNNGELLLSSLQTKDYRNFMSIDYVNEDQTEDICFEKVEIEFRDVYFSYYMQDGFALENVSFKLKVGEKLALVGYNGAGKTTIVKLLTGLYQPTKGKILLNNKDITTIKRDSLAKMMAPVFQETLFFPLSIEENIAMALSDGKDADGMGEIIKLVQMEEKIRSLPEGIQTILSRELDNKGVDLSGGESQKLSLARALYKDNLVYILDEPTSALDAISEYEMYKNFDEITKGHTTIYISHRLSSTRFCDRIILLDKGRITEEGPHERLMANRGKYYELFTMQAKYYKENGDKDA